LPGLATQSARLKPAGKPTGKEQARIMAMVSPIKIATAILAGLLAAAPHAGSASTPGTDLPPLGDLSGLGKANAGLPPARIEEALRKARADTADALRAPAFGPKVGAIGKPVALVVTPDRLGSATLVAASGRFITSWNVVRQNTRVGLIFMPGSDRDRPTEADAVTATVIRIDPVRDLALLEFAPVPQGMTPVPFATNAPLRQGMALRIVGHPYGEIWSMSEGRLNTAIRTHAWTSASGQKHTASVIRFRSSGATGNSGDPVFNAKGHLVAMDVSPADTTTLTSIAVTAAEIRRFMSSDTPSVVRDAVPVRAKASAMPRLAPAPMPAPEPACSPTPLGTSRTPAADATLHLIDLDCNGRKDAELLLPDNSKETGSLSVDANGDGVTETTYLDLNRDGRFDEVRFDTNADGKPDLLGTDLDPTLVPRRTRTLDR
jgi:S1-C subfamily serine protease